MSDVCGDNRFEIIEAYKKKLIEDTNIESSPDEMAVIDNILLRFWQMGWLPDVTDTNVGDMIYRQDAIDVLEERLRANGYSNVPLVSELNRSIGYLMRLPSAQTEIIRCKDCKHYEFSDDRAFGLPTMCCKQTGFEDMDDDDFCSRAERRQDGSV